MANDAFVLKKTIDIALGETRDFVKIEFVKSGAEVLTLGEDSAPT